MTPSPLTRPALAALALALTGSLLRPLLPGSQSYQQVFVPGWLVPAAAALGALALFGRFRTLTGALSCVLLLWAGSGLPLDGFRMFFWATGIPAGDFALVDWPGVLSRGTALLALGTLLLALLRTRRTEPGDQRRLGHAALALAMPYPALKLYWSLGGTLALPADGTNTVPLGEVLAFAAAAALGHALVQPWGHRLPRPLLLLGGALAAATLISQGSMPIFAALSTALGGPALPFDTGSPAALIVLAVYLSWVLLGVVLGAATLGFTDRTRTPRSTVLT
ncbi:MULTISPECIES: hypothetical protein [unclassified Crossiella]|uniref:hypothetical protein n=1 Tax=unclassified Crossiella TaxID=2620835 RepID=UPI001FFFE9D5|nr:MULTISPECIES: hypothetical protein [unclassified Crossiella]MCK2240701.1 hypothetical protein [Crossiella sp. S99.2]MCK2252848.1 hypothetical protein [Crossiella sp. S99.1]